VEPQRAAAARSENFIVRKLGSYDSVVQYSGEQWLLRRSKVVWLCGAKFWIFSIARWISDVEINYSMAVVGCGIVDGEDMM